MAQMTTAERGRCALSARIAASRDVGSRGQHAPRSALDRALAEYTQQHYRAAFGALARLAEHAHPVAARMAPQMVEHGTRLYGGRFEADVATRQRWRALAAQATEPSKGLS